MSIGWRFNGQTRSAAEGEADEPHEAANKTTRFNDPQVDLRRRYVAAVSAHHRQVARLMQSGMGEWTALQATPPIDFEPFVDLRCGARGKRTGRPCPQKGIYSNGRCRWHGGLSTGPRTATGKARSAQNAVRNEPLERGNLEVSVPLRESVEEAEPDLDRDWTMSSVLPDSTQWRVLEWLTRRAWRPSPEARMSQALSLAPMKLRWVLQCLQRRGFVTDVRGADSDVVAWQVRRERL